MFNEDNIKSMRALSQSEVDIMASCADDIEDTKFSEIIVSLSSSVLHTYLTLRTDSYCYETDVTSFEEFIEALGNTVMTQVIAVGILGPTNSAVLLLESQATCGISVDELLPVLLEGDVTPGLLYKSFKIVAVWDLIGTSV